MVVSSSGDGSPLFAVLELVPDATGKIAGPCPERVEIAENPFVVGRYPDSTLYLVNSCISGRHCVFTKQALTASQQVCADASGGRGYHVVLADTSTNGCAVNGVYVGRGRTVVLNDGDLVGLVQAALPDKAMYNMTYRFTLPPLAPQIEVGLAPSPKAAQQLEATQLREPIGASQAYEYAAQINMSDLDSDVDDGAPTSSSSAAAPPAPSMAAPALKAGGDRDAPALPPLRAAPAAPAGQTTPAAVGRNRDTLVKRIHINTSYDLHEPLGSGTFATVYRATHRRTGRIVAIKQINKMRLSLGQQSDPKSKAAFERDMERQRREVDILLSVRHPHVVRCYAVYETDEHLWFVMSYAAGGELLQLLKVGGPLSEPIVRRIMQQLISAICYLHSVGIVHRDLKLENLLLYRPLSDVPPRGDVAAMNAWLDGLHLQVSDFGLSRVLGTETSLMVTMCGTPVYVAPEVTDHSLRVDGPKGYTPAVDIYSCGIVAFALLVGRPPFPHLRDSRGQTMKTRIDFSQPINWTHSHAASSAEVPSASARFAVERMLSIDPKARPSAAACAELLWLVQDGHAPIHPQGPSAGKRERPS